ncbi:unnamed protein product [Caenorhabditis sp. 36 PRJEB53466]|nr:unnamed protein product [Caenorhabditis sp. 36 PRJEB53466]
MSLTAKPGDDTTLQRSATSRQPKRKRHGSSRMRSPNDVPYTEEETTNEKSRKAPTPSNKKKDATKAPNVAVDRKSPKTESQKIMKATKKE